MLNKSGNLSINLIEVSACLFEFRDDVALLFFSQMGVSFLGEALLNGAHILTDDFVLDFNTAELSVIGVELDESMPDNNGFTNGLKVVKFLLVFFQGRVFSLVVNPIKC